MRRNRFIDIPTGDVVKTGKLSRIAKSLLWDLLRIVAENRCKSGLVINFHTMSWKSPASLKTAKDELLKYGFIQLSEEGSGTRPNRYKVECCHFREHVVGCQR